MNLLRQAEILHGKGQAPVSPGMAKLIRAAFEARVKPETTARLFPGLACAG